MRPCHKGHPFSTIDTYPDTNLNKNTINWAGRMNWHNTCKSEGPKLFFIRLRDKMRIGPNVVHHQKLNYHIDFAQGVAHFGELALLDMASNTYAAGAIKELESVRIICLLSSRCCYQFLHFVHCDFRARIFMWFLELPSQVLFTPAVLGDPCFVCCQCSLCIHRICIAVFINTIIWRTKLTQFHHWLSASSGAVIF